MDIPINRQRRLVAPKAIGLVVLTATVLGGLVFAAWPTGSRLRKSELHLVRVARGNVQLPVAAYGSMISLSQKLLTSPAPAVVEEVIASAGTLVRKGDIIVRLSSPSTTQVLVQANAAVNKAQLDLKDAILNQRMDEISETGKFRAADTQAKVESRERDAIKPLAQSGIISKIEMQREESKVETLQMQAENQKIRLGLVRDLGKSKVEAREDAVRQAHLVLAQAQANVDALTVRAAIAGPVEEVFVSLGQSVAQGEKIAQVADVKNLAASLKVPQSRASTLAIGSPATLSIMNQNLTGHVIRVDPRVRDGAVLVDVALDVALPSGIRVGQSVSGEIRAGAGSDTVYLPRTSSMTPYEHTTVFVLEGHLLAQRAVQFGGANVNQIEVVAGLGVGDQVATNIPSDLSSEKYITVVQ